MTEKAFTLQEGQIFLHKNWKAKDNQPVTKGSCMIDGKEYEISLWKSKSGKEGSFSGKVKVADNSWKTGSSTHKGFDKQGDITPSNPVTTLADLNDEINF